MWKILSSTLMMSSLDIDLAPKTTSRSPITESKLESARERKQAELAHLERAVINKDTHFVDENLARAENEDKVTPYLVFLIAVAAIAGFLFGYDTAVIGVALPHVGSDLGHPLTHGEQEIITAGCTIGAIFGSAILGSLADKLGRRLSLFIADIFFTVGAVIIAASYSVPQMIVGRLILGIGVGAAGVIGPLYIAELAPTAIRGRCIGTNAFFIPFGQAVASAIGAGLNDANPTLAWRLLFALGVVPSVLQLVLVHWLPESPRVLILRGQDDKARVAIRRIYRDATENIIDLKLQICAEYVHQTTVMQREFSLTQRIQRFWSHKPYRRAIICVSGVQAFGQLTGFNTLLYYSGTIFGLLGLSNPAAASLIPAGGNALFLFIGMLVVDRFGRRRLLVTFIPGMVAGLVWVTVTFVFMTRNTGNQLDAAVTYEMKYVGNVLGALILFTCSFGLTYSHIVWYQSELLALEIRAAGSAIATTACWIANLIVSISFLSMLNGMTPMGVYGFYLGITIIGYTFVYFCYPETRGLSIDETSLLFEEGFGVLKSRQMLAEKQELAKRFQHESQVA